MELRWGGLDCRRADGPIDSECGEVGRKKSVGLSDFVVLGFIETWDGTIMEGWQVWVWLGRAVICTMGESLLEKNSKFFISPGFNSLVVVFIDVFAFCLVKIALRVVVPAWTHWIGFSLPHGTACRLILPLSTTFIRFFLSWDT